MTKIVKIDSIEYIKHIVGKDQLEIIGSNEYNKKIKITIKLWTTPDIEYIE